MRNPGIEDFSLIFNSILKGIYDGKCFQPLQITDSTALLQSRVAKVLYCPQFFYFHTPDWRDSVVVFLGRRTVIML